MKTRLRIGRIKLQKRLSQYQDMNVIFNDLMLCNSSNFLGFIYEIDVISLIP
jgi:hypothetical protein